MATRCPVLRKHFRQRRRERVDRTHQVDADHVLDIGHVHRFEERRLADPRIGDDQIDRTEFFANVLKGRFDLPAVADIGNRDRGCAAACGDERLQLAERCFAPRDQPDLTPLTRELLRQLPADPARCPRDEHDFA